MGWDGVGWDGMGVCLVLMVREGGCEGGGREM